MSGRTPSFIVVGLVIIMFLLGLFYMSCSSKNTELRLSIEQFEDRIRSLTIKNSDIQKKMEDISARKRELEEEKANIEKQMGKKDSEINDLNTKLNEKTAEIETLKTDKNVVNEQLKEYKSLRETVNEKNSQVEKLQQEIQDLKQSGNDELTRLKQEIDVLKTNHSLLLNTTLISNNNNNNNTEQQNAFQIPAGRFQPLLPKNQTSRGLSALFEDPYNKLNNLTREVRAEIVPAVIDVKNKVLNAIGINTNSSMAAGNDTETNPEAGQNIPPPPGLIENNIQSVDTQNRENQLGADNPRLLNSLDKKNADDEIDDEEQLGANNAQENLKLPSNVLKENDQENFKDNNNYRIGNRGQDRENRNQQRLDNGEEIEHNDDIDQRFRKRNVR